MTKEELKARVNYKPIQIPDSPNMKLSTKLRPYEDNERMVFGGYRRCTSNVLAKENDATAMAMCKD